MSLKQVIMISEARIVTVLTLCPSDTTVMKNKTCLRFNFFCFLCNFLSVCSEEPLPLLCWLFSQLLYLCYFSFIGHLKILFSSVAQSCPPLCNPMEYSMPGFPFHHQLPELA